MKKSVFSLLAVAVLGGAQLVAQTTVATNPVGFTTVPLNAGANIVVPTLINVDTYDGNATFAATAVTPAVNPNWTAGAFAETSFASPTPNYPAYYVEVTSGTYAGYCFDIVTNTASALMLPSGDVPAGLVGQTVTIAVRHHVTLDQLATGETGLTAYADVLSLFNSDGSTSVRYFTGTSWVAEDFSTPAGQTIVYPGQGFTLSTAATAQLLLVGPVKTTSTAVPLYKGVVNIVGPLSPASAATLVNSNIAPALSPYADTIDAFSTDGKLTNTTAYYSDGTNVLNAAYSPLPANAPDAFPLNGGVTINVTNNTIWMTKSPLAP
jgi:hypothetical protein